MLGQIPQHPDELKDQKTNKEFFGMQGGSPTDYGVLNRIEGALDVGPHKKIKLNFIYYPQ